MQSSRISRFKSIPFSSNYVFSIESSQRKNSKQDSVWYWNMIPVDPARTKPKHLTFFWLRFGFCGVYRARFLLLLRWGWRRRWNLIAEWGGAGAVIFIAVSCVTTSTVVSSVKEERNERERKEEKWKTRKKRKECASLGFFIVFQVILWKSLTRINH